MSTGSIPERQSGTLTGNAGGEEAGAAELGKGWQRDSYSSAQRVYLDRLEQGAYNAYASGLLFAPLLARYHFLPTLSRVITTATQEGYSLAELALTLFYLDLFGFRSLEDFKRAYPEEFGVLMGLINYTPGYVLEELEKQPLVESPEFREVEKQRAGLVSELNRLKIGLADHLLEPPTKKRRTPSRSQKEVRDENTVIEGQILLADERLDKLPSVVRF